MTCVARKQHIASRFSAIWGAAHEPKDAISQIEERHNKAASTSGPRSRGGAGTGATGASAQLNVSWLRRYCAHAECTDPQAPRPADEAGQHRESQAPRVKSNAARLHWDFFPDRREPEGAEQRIGR